MKSFISCILFLLISLGFFACNRDTVFSEYHKFEKNTWKRINDDVKFEVEIEDISQKYDIHIPVRHASFYPHQYLELGFNIYSPSGQESYSVKKIYLKDTRGEWKGEGMGDIWDFDYRIFEHYSFNETGKYTFEIQNLTGNNLFLPGVMEIGLIIKKAK